VFTPTTRRNCRQLVANSCTQRRRDETRQFRLVGVGGVYWALLTSAIANIQSAGRISFCSSWEMVPFCKARYKNIVNTFSARVTYTSRNATDEFLRRKCHRYYPSRLVRLNASPEGDDGTASVHDVQERSALEWIPLEMGIEPN